MLTAAAPAAHLRASPADGTLRSAVPVGCRMHGGVHAMRRDSRDCPAVRRAQRDAVELPRPEPREASRGAHALSLFRGLRLPSTAAAILDNMPGRVTSMTHERGRVRSKALSEYPVPPAQLAGRLAVRDPSHSEYRDRQPQWPLKSSGDPNRFPIRRLRSCPAPRERLWPAACGGRGGGAAARDGFREYRPARRPYCRPSR